MKKKICMLLFLTILISSLSPYFVYAQEEPVLELNYIDENTIQIKEKGVLKTIKIYEDKVSKVTKVINESGEVESTFYLDKIENTLSSSITKKVIDLDKKEANFSFVPKLKSYGEIKPFGYDGGTCPIGSEKAMPNLRFTYAEIVSAVGWGIEIAAIAGFLYAGGVGAIDIAMLNQIHDCLDAVRDLGGIHLSKSVIVLNGVGVCQRKCRGNYCYTAYYFNVRSVYTF